MNQKEKLTEATMLALQGKLIEDTDINQYYKNFSNKVRQIAQGLTHCTSTRERRTKNMITIEIDQASIINRKDCQNYIQQKAKCPLKHRVDYEVKGDEYILNDEFNKAVDYVDNKYIPGLKDYMDSQNKECLDLIQQTFKNNNVVIKDIKDNAEISNLYNRYKNQDVRGIIDNILRGWENPDELYPYQHIYTITIDINDNKDINVDSGKYKVSYNPNYMEYTVRDKKNGKVYYASKNPDKAYAELKRLNDGGERGSALKPVHWWE